MGHNHGLFCIVFAVDGNAHHVVLRRLSLNLHGLDAVVVTSDGKVAHVGGRSVQVHQDLVTHGHGRLEELECLSPRIDNA